MDADTIICHNILQIFHYSEKVTAQNPSQKQTLRLGFKCFCFCLLIKAIPILKS